MYHSPACGDGGNCVLDEWVSIILLVAFKCDDTHPRRGRRNMFARIRKNQMEDQQLPDHFKHEVG